MQQFKSLQLAVDPRPPVSAADFYNLEPDEGVSSCCMLDCTTTTTSTSAREVPCCCLIGAFWRRGVSFCPVLCNRELHSQQSDRSCLHVELSLEGTGVGLSGSTQTSACMLWPGCKQGAAGGQWLEVSMQEQALTRDAREPGWIGSAAYWHAA